VNEHGLIAGLTNQPMAADRDPRKRSRGELPLAFAAHEDAATAMTAVTVDPARYNPCWMLVGDRRSLFFVGIGSGSGAKAETEQLGPGLHVLENAPLRARSAKAVFVEQLVRDELAARPRADADSTVAALEAVLRVHEPAVRAPRTDETGRTWPAEISAPCVHTQAYGTRSAMTAWVPPAGRPGVRVADGPPCRVPFRDVTGLWSDAQPASTR
jgi:uncharacterized protein with NRDE domain